MDHFVYLSFADRWYSFYAIYVNTSSPNLQFVVWIVIMISMWWWTSSIIYLNYGQKKISGKEFIFCPHNKISGSALKWFIFKYGIELSKIEGVNDILLNLLKNINDMLYIYIKKKKN